MPDTKSKKLTDKEIANLAVKVAELSKNASDNNDCFVVLTIAASILARQPAHLVFDGF